MAYASFDDYTALYFGKKISTEAEFTAPSERASEIIDSATFDRAKDNIDEDIARKLKLCCCAITEQIIIYENGTRQKSSEKIGSYSVTYADRSDAEIRNKYRSILMQYLGNTGLLYRGC